MHIRTLTKKMPVKADVIQTLDIVTAVLNIIAQINSILTSLAKGTS